MYSVRPSLIMIGEILVLRFYLHYNFYVVVVLPKYPKNINVTWHGDIKISLEASNSATPSERSEH